MRYVAYAVDLSGVARTAYEVESADDDEARRRAEKFLEAHQAIELWKGVRIVARLTRERVEPDTLADAATETVKASAAP